MKHTEKATDPPLLPSGMHVAVVSDDIAEAMKLESVLRSAGVPEVACLDSLDALQLHMHEQSVDVVVGRISQELCNGLGIPDVLRKSNTTGKARSRPHLLWIGKSSFGAPSPKWNGIAASTPSAAGTKQGKAKLLGGVPFAALQLYGKLLRADGIHVAICPDEDASNLLDTLAALAATRRTKWEAADKSVANPPTEDEVVEALATGQGLRVVFQPQYRLSTRETVGAEALIRWRHPRCGDVSPALFVQIVDFHPEVTHWGCGRKLGLSGGSSCIPTEIGFEQLSSTSSWAGACGRPSVSSVIQQRIL